MDDLTPLSMSVNITPKDIRDRVLDCIAKKQSFFMLRLGDGDMKTAQGNDSLPKYSHSLIGRNISSEELIYTQNNLSKCVLNSDVLGLPTPIHATKHYLWKYLFEYYQDIYKTHRDEWVDKHYCTIDSHVELLVSGDLYEIFRNVTKLVIVSPRDIGEKLKEKFTNIVEIEYYSIPGEQKYEIHKNTEIDFFTRLGEIIMSIKSKQREGELLIYGAGTFGKVIGLEFKQMGGVVLDLGSVFDMFVGKKTRGQGKGPESYETPYLEI